MTVQNVFTLLSCQNVRLVCLRLVPEDRTFGNVLWILLIYILATWARLRCLQAHGLVEVFMLDMAKETKAIAWEEAWYGQVCFELLNEPQGIYNWMLIVASRVAFIGLSFRKY